MTVLFSAAPFIKGEFFKELQTPGGKKDLKIAATVGMKVVSMEDFFFYTFPRGGQCPHAAPPSLKVLCWIAEPDVGLITL